MTFAEWARDTGSRVREDGVDGVRESVYQLYIGGLRRISRFYGGGTNVFECDWDLLVLLDGCRVDLLADVAPKYSCLGDPGKLTSVGSSSIEWLERTFTGEYRDEMATTAYVSANPFTHRVLSDEDLCVLDEVWRYAFDDDLGTVPARPVTDRAVAVGREHDPDRLIVHYMQPHFPSVPDPLSTGMNRETLGEGEGWRSPWEMLRRGDLDRETVWGAYRTNLEYVLEDVQLLLTNTDAERAVVTADHGNAAGEWGVYGHPKVALSALRQVPWYRTSAEDGGDYRPTVDPDAGTVVTDDDVKDQLAALGYT